MPNRKAIDALSEEAGAPFAWGSLVDIDGWQGVVVEARGQYVGVILAEDATETVRFFSTSDARIKYYRVIAPGKLKEWWVKAPGYEWDDIDNLIIVTSSRFTKARYKGWKKADDAGVVTRADLLLMRTKRKFSSDDRERWGISVPEMREYSSIS